MGYYNQKGGKQGKRGKGGASQDDDRGNQQRWAGTSMGSNQPWPGTSTWSTQQQVGRAQRVPYQSPGFSG